MTTLKTRLLRGAALSLVVLALGTQARAQEEARARRSDALRRPATFNVSGTYTGVLGNQVMIAGVSYRLGDAPRLYRIGVGLVSVSELPIGSLVYAFGSGSPDAGTITGLVARPPVEAMEANSVSANVREMPASSPK